MAQFNFTLDEAMVKEVILGEIVHGKTPVFNVFLMNGYFVARSAASISKSETQFQSGWRLKLQKK
jgi:hypothetical protein